MIATSGVILTAYVCTEPDRGIQQGSVGGILMELGRSEVAVRSLGDGGVMRYAPRTHNWDDGYIANLVLEHLEDLLGRNAEGERMFILIWVRSLLRGLERNSDS